MKLPKGKPACMALKPKRDLYIAVMKAFAEGKGINLTWDECSDLWMDDAFSSYAFNSLEKDEAELVERDRIDGWRKIDPRRYRTKPWNMNCRTADGEWGVEGTDPLIST